MSAAHKRLTGGLVFLALSGFYGWEAGNIALFFTREGQVFTARTVPYALSLLGIAFSLFLVIPAALTLIGKPATAAEGAARGAVRRLDWRPVILLVVLMSAYVALFSLLGFLVATTGFLMGAFAVLGGRGPRSLLVIPIGTVAVFWLLVSVVMNIHLAEGTIWNVFR